MTIDEKKRRIDRSYARLVQWIRDEILSDNPWPEGRYLFSAAKGWKVGITAWSPDTKIARPDVFLVRDGLNTPEHPMLFGTDREYRSGTMIPVLEAGCEPLGYWTDGKEAALLAWMDDARDDVVSKLNACRRILGYDFKP